MAGIFVSYRRDDAAAEALMIKQALVAHFRDRETIFMDIDNSEYGSDFRTPINDALKNCDVFLAIIGRDWLDVKTESGRRRLDEEDDWIRYETAAALARQRLSVIPVLVQRASLPTKSHLPEDLQGLVFRQALELRHTAWNADLEVLIRAIEKAHNRAREAAELEARQRAEEEERRLIKEAEQKTEDDARRRAEEEAELKAEVEARRSVERDAQRREEERMRREAEEAAGPDREDARTDGTEAEARRTAVGRRDRRTYFGRRFQLLLVIGVVLAAGYVKLQPRELVVNTPPPLPSPPPSSRADDAIRVVRDYYDALGRNDVNDAKAKWIEPPRNLAALVVNSDDFKIDDIQIDNLTETYASVRVDLVETVESGSTRRWRGPIDLGLKSDGQWGIARMRVVPDSFPPPSPETPSPERALLEYYAAVDRRDYPAASSMWVSEPKLLAGLIGSTEYAKLLKTRVAAADESSATVEVEVETKAEGGPQQRWRGQVQLVLMSGRWSISSMSGLKKVN